MARLLESIISVLKGGGNSMAAGRDALRKSAVKKSISIDKDEVIFSHRADLSRIALKAKERLRDSGALVSYSDYEMEPVSLALKAR